MTRAEAVRAAAARLRGASCDTPELDARLLGAEAFGLTAAGLLGGGAGEATAAGLDALARLVDRRAGGEPVARILGRREFWGLDFSLAAETLVPRPDTETVVEAALRETGGRDRALEILDLGTGSGCILLALLAERPNARGLGLDRSFGAASAAWANAAALGLSGRARFAVGSWADALDARFDLVVSNPPYIPSGDVGGLQREVAEHDPRLALDGGPDGLDAYRALAGALGGLLAPDGVAVLEIGIGQSPAVSRLMAGAGLAVARVVDDLAGVARAMAVRPDPARAAM